MGHVLPAVVETHPASVTVGGLDVSVASLYESMDRLLPLGRRTLSAASIYRAVTSLAYQFFPASDICVTVEQPGRGLIVEAANGRRPGMSRPGVRLPQLAGWEQAWSTRLPRLLRFDPSRPPGAGDWRLFGSPAISTGVIIPFLTAGRARAALVLAEERRPERAPITPAAEAALMAIVRRGADVLALCHLREEREPSRTTPAPHSTVTERQRLARELHDGAGQPLSSLLMKIRAVKARGYAAVDDLHGLEMAAEEAIEAVRSVAQGLRSLVPAFGQLASARRYAETILDASGASLSWSDRLGDTVLDHGLLREVASVIKESVTNIVRHARARTVSVDLSLAEGCVRVTVEDDGIGLGPAAGEAPGLSGLGLLGNHERIARLGGRFSVSPRPSGGTLVAIEVPRAQPADHAMTASSSADAVLDLEKAVVRAAS